MTIQIREKALLLVNGSSGTGQLARGVFDIVQRLTVHGYEVTVYPILHNYGLGAEAILRDIYQKYSLIVCCGGDGTLHHVINELMLHEKRPTLGYIPAGSTNDFARGMRIPKALEEACDVLVNGEPFAYDIGCFNDKFFNYIAAFGAFVTVSYATDQKLKNVLGHAAYLLNGISQLPENVKYSCHMTIETDEGMEEGDYLFGAVYNTTSVGGFPIRGAMQSRLGDGKMELLLIHKPDNILEVSQIANALLSGNASKNPYITFKQITHVHMIPDKDTSWTLDGEAGGSPSEIDIKVAAAAMRIMVPA